MTADEVFEDMALRLAADGVTVAAMFGKRSLKARGKGFACLMGDALAFRLGDGTADHTAALALRGAELFDPSGRDRPFKDWVIVPVSHAKKWPHFAAAALSHLGR